MFSSLTVFRLIFKPTADFVYRRRFFPPALHYFLYLQRLLVISVFKKTDLLTKCFVVGGALS